MRLSKVTPGLLKIEQDCIFHLLYVCTLLSHIHTHPGNAPWCFRAPPLPQTVKDVLWNGGNKAQEDGHLHEGTLYTRKSHNWKHSNRESPCKCSKYPPGKDHPLGHAMASFLWSVKTLAPAAEHQPLLYKAAPWDKMKLLRVSAEAGTKLAAAVEQGRGICSEEGPDCSPQPSPCQAGCMTQAEQQLGCSIWA